MKCKLNEAKRLKGKEAKRQNLNLLTSSPFRLFTFLSGFTLIELIIFLVLAGVILPFIFIPFMTGLKDYKTPEIVSTATFLGEELMEEIKSKQFDENPSSPTGSIGPESGDVRGTPPTYNDSTYKDVDDYNNLNNGLGETPLGFSGYIRKATVFYVNPAGDLDTSYAAPVENRRIKRIQVTVTYTSENLSVVLATLVSNN